MPVATSIRDEPTQYEAIIVGGGPSGIASACRFQMDLGLTNYLLFEQGNDLGGTWHNNQYPGAGCDIPTRLYSFGFAQKKNWDQFFSLQPEIKDYLKEVARRFQVDQHARLNTKVTSAQWMPERCHWRVTARHADQGEKTYTARVFVSGVGALSIPRDCDVPGADSFKGAIFHSADWRKDVELKDKNVVVLGNGCSAAQVVPSIAPKVKQLTQIVRSKHWIVPQLLNPLDGGAGRWLERWVPGFVGLERALIILLCETHFLQVFKKEGVAARQRFAKLSREYIFRAAPPELVDTLLPTNEEVQVACKRRIFDAGYVPSLNRKNVELTTDQAAQINENSVTLKSGRTVDADVIILCNGFKTNGAQPMDIINGDGLTLEQYWKNTAGVPQAYRGTFCNPFPNMCLIWGPNTVTGHYSAIQSIETCVELMTSVLRPIFLPPSDNPLAKATNGALQRSEGRSVQVKKDAEELEQVFIQDCMKKYIFTTGCGSWYTDPASGRVTALAPTFQTAVAVRNRCPVFSDFEYSGVSKTAAWRSWTVVQRITSLVGIGRTPDHRTNAEAQRGFLSRVLRALVFTPAYKVLAFFGLYILRGASFFIDTVVPWKLPPRKHAAAAGRIKTA